MFLSNRGIIFHVLGWMYKKFPKGRVQALREELISCANLALLRSIESYDEDSGNKFSTYATTCVYRAMVRVLAEDGIVKLPLRIVMKDKTFFEYDDFDVAMEQEPIEKDIPDDEKNELWGMVGSMNYPYSRIVQCTFLEGLSIRQTAKELRIKVATVKVMQNECMKYLRERLGNV